MHRVWQVVFDGEPSMSGKPHVVASSGEYTDLKVAQAALDIVTRNNKWSPKTNIRLRTREVTDWEDVDG